MNPRRHLSSADTAARFAAVYQQRTAPRPRVGVRNPRRAHWVAFRCSVLAACQARPRTAADLGGLLDSVERIAHRNRNLRALLVRGYLVRDEGGYRTTPRGARVLADLEMLEGA